MERKIALAINTEVDIDHEEIVPELMNIIYGSNYLLRGDGIDSTEIEAALRKAIESTRGVTEEELYGPTDKPENPKYGHFNRRPGWDDTKRSQGENDRRDDYE